MRVKLLKRASYVDPETGRHYVGLEGDIVAVSLEQGTQMVLHGHAEAVEAPEPVVEDAPVEVVEEPAETDAPAKAKGKGRKSSKNDEDEA